MLGVNDDVGLLPHAVLTLYYFHKTEWVPFLSIYINFVIGFTPLNQLSSAIEIDGHKVSVHTD